MKSWAFISFLIYFNLSVNAQIDKEIELNIQNYTIQNGLPSNNVNFVFQDYKGFIWIGTYTGLTKFNGYQFLNFNPNPTLANAIKVGHYISYLKESDSIYLLTTKLDGVQRLNIENNTLTRIKNSPASPKNITKDKDGTYWIGTLADGFYHYLPKSQKFEQIILKPLTKDFNHNWDNNTINEICIDNVNDSILWLGCRNGLHSYHKFTKKFQLFSAEHQLSMHQFALNQITSLTQEKNGTIWAGKFFGGIGKFDPKTSKWEHFFYDPESFKLKVLNNNIVDNLKWINANTLSVSTSDGPMHFNIDNKKFTKLKLQNKDNKIIGDVIDYFTDKDGNLWFSNINQNGVTFASQQFNSTKKYSFPKQKFMPDYYGSVVLDMFWSKKYQAYFLANTNHDGLLIYNKKFELLKQVQIPANWEDKEPFPISIGEDTEGNIWISDITNQLMIYNHQKVENYYHNEFQYCFEIIRGIQNELYYNTEKGLFKYSNNKWQKILDAKENRIYSNIYDWRIYFIDYLNLYVYDFKKNKIEKIYELPKFAVESGNYIHKIFIDSKDKLWIPIEFGGIYNLDLNVHKLKLFGFQEGLTNNTVRHVKEDKGGRIFVLCNGGLFYYNSLKNRFIDFDNLTHQKVNDWYEHGLFLTENDELLVTKENAFYVINKNLVLKENTRVPIITDIHSQENHFVNGFENILIPNYQNDVKIFFSNFDYSNPKEVLYEYQFSGFSKNWIKIEKGLNHVSFVNLKEGNYWFKVRLVGSNEFTICKFTIKTIWYKSQLFYILLSIFLISIILIISIYFIRKKNKEKELQKRIAELKLISLQSQLNPHFLFNCLTSISGLIKTKEYDKSEKILNDFAKLMRAILSNSNKDLISLEEELKISKLYLEIEKIRKNNAFTFEFKINSNVDMASLVPPLILQPFLENSVKHGFINKTEDNIGFIIVDIQNEEHELKIKIKDNGIGISKEKPIFKDHQSMGIEIQKERLEQYEVTHQMKFMVETKFKKDKGAEILIIKSV